MNDLAGGVDQSLEFLDKLRQAAPAGSAARLEQIIRLLQALAQENDYLNSLVTEGIASVTASEPPPPPTAPPEPAPVELPESELLTLLNGLNDGMRAPLVAIRGRAELIEAGLLGQISEEQRQWLRAVHENTERAFTLLDTVQQIILLRAGQTKITWNTFVSSDLLQEAYNRIQDAARARQHELTLHLPDTVPMARGDFYQTLIILADLLDNAVHYTPPGGQIRLSAESLGTHVLFSIMDNGIGFTAEQAPYVGTPFWRGSHRLVRQHPGHGLRLYLARQVLALQGGELIYSAQPSLGSTFSFTLALPD
jgi:two-component system phosphate regulon sensor histidine kinase PhoR